MGENVCHYFYEKQKVFFEEFYLCCVLGRKKENQYAETLLFRVGCSWAVRWLSPSRERAGRLCEVPYVQGRPEYCWERPSEFLESLERRGAHASRTKIGIMTRSPLLDKSCRPVSAAEERRIRLDRSKEPPVYLESPIGLTYRRTNSSG